MFKLVLSTSLLLLATACALPPAVDTPVAAQRERARALFGTVAPVTDAEVSHPQAVLGRALFWDERLSLDGKTACASCHTRADWSSDRRRLSINAKQQPTTLHSQPMFMAQDQASLRWYGDRRDGAHQAERSITGSMGMPDTKAMHALLQTHGYAGRFAAAFGTPADPVTAQNYAQALMVYQRTLRTPAPFDAFLNGDDTALTPRQRAGLDKFVSSGCAGCHNGPLLGGTALTKFGLTKDYWKATGSTTIDPGRYTVTKAEADRYVFRVPMLRNIAKTAPYFHDGSVDALEDAVRVMADVQLGLQLSTQDVSDIAAFLQSLTGAMPAHYAPPQ